MKVGSIWCNMSFVWKYCLNLERTSSQLLSDWSRHCCQASSLVLQECVDQSERLTDCSKKIWQNRRQFCHDVPLLPLTGETSLKRHDQYGPEHVNTDYLSFTHHQLHGNLENEYFVTMTACRGPGKSEKTIVYCFLQSISKSPPTPARTSTEPVAAATLHYTTCTVDDTFLDRRS